MSNITKTSKVLMTKQEKIKRLISRIALSIAAKENPSLYSRYADLRKKYLVLKLGVIKKYTPKAIMVAREIVKNANKK
jgi:hypothetical protein